MKRKIFELRPTQFSLGMQEVSTKREKIKRMSESELEEYLDAHKIPVVICRDGEAHLIDHHHLVRACWEAGVHKVVTEVKADLSGLSVEAFWKAMIERKWTHLIDQLGNGPHEPRLLPLDVRGLADDPYRSLAWAVREAGGYNKTDELFAEFRWAEYFRARLEILRTDDGFTTALAQAMKLTLQSEAKHLPGFIGSAKK